MFRQVIIGVVFITIVVIAVGAVALHYKEHKLYQEEIAMNLSETDYLEAVLKEKNADDCIVEPAAYGWKCTDFKGRVYRVYRNEAKMKTIQSNPVQGANHRNSARPEIH